MAEKEAIYWKDDPNLRLVRYDEETRNPNYNNDKTNERIEQVRAKAANTLSALMNDLKDNDLIPELDVKKANRTGDPAHDKYPARAVISAGRKIVEPFC